MFGSSVINHLDLVSKMTQKVVMLLKMESHYNVSQGLLHKHFLQVWTLKDQKCDSFCLEGDVTEYLLK